MELKDFIKEAITAIAQATIELQRELGPEGILVNPPTNGRDENTFVEGDDRYHHRPVRDVEFDVALTVEKSGGGSAGVKAKVAIFEASVGGELSGSSQQVSRLKFTMPLALKATEEETKNRAEAEKKWNKPLGVSGGKGSL
jgi:hypothetical protein